MRNYHIALRLEGLTVAIRQRPAGFRKGPNNLFHVCVEDHLRFGGGAVERQQQRLTQALGCVPPIEEVVVMRQQKRQVVVRLTLNLPSARAYPCSSLSIICVHRSGSMT